MVLALLVVGVGAVPPRQRRRASEIEVAAYLAFQKSVFTTFENRICIDYKLLEARKKAYEECW